MSNNNTETKSIEVVVDGRDFEADNRQPDEVIAVKPTPGRRHRILLGLGVVSLTVAAALGAVWIVSEQRSSSSPSAAASCPGRPTPEELPGKKGVGVLWDVSSTLEENINRLMQVGPYWAHSMDMAAMDHMPNSVEMIPMVSIEESL